MTSFLLIAVILCVLYGGSRIPDMMRGLAEGLDGRGGNGPTAPAVVVPRDPPEAA